MNQAQPSAGMQPNKPMVPTAHTRPYIHPLYSLRRHIGQPFATLGVLMLAFAGAWMTGACGSNDAGPVHACPTPPDSPSDTPADTPTTCPASVAEPCMRYRIPLFGNPSMDVPLRNKYIAAFGSACYMSEVNTFDCFYKKWQDACADAVKIAEVSGNAPFDKGYTCQPDGVGNYTLQVGPDIANQIQINYQAAPRETPLIEIDGVPTEVNGPYRNLSEPQKLTPGERFYCNTVDKNGNSVVQRDLIIQVNSKAHGGTIHSDLPGFEYPCGVDANCQPKFCKEPLVLKSGPQNDPDAAQVHHVVRRRDLRGCDWGTNSNKNAAVISRQLNIYLTNNYPSAEEIKRVNQVPAYTP